MLLPTILAAACTGYYSVAEVRLNCTPAPLAVGSASGVARSPDGTTVAVSNATGGGVDPIVFAAASPTTLCAGSLYGGTAEVPRYCTAGGVAARWACPSETDSGRCWTQSAAGARQLDFRAEYATTWERCGPGCTVAVTWAKPHWFDDVLAMAVCAGLLAIAITAPRVESRTDLLFNWAFACSTLAVSHERLPLQPLWSHGLLAAVAATAVVLRGRRLEAVLMALIAATLPSRSLGASAVRIVRFVMGLGLCGWSGYRPSVQTAGGMLWAVTALLYPVVVTAGGGWVESGMIAVSAAVAGWASNFPR